MKYTLYAVEVLVNSNPLTYDLIRRNDETGEGSPLTWTDKAGAEEFVGSIVREVGGDVEPDLQVVPLSGETDSENETEEHFTVL